MGVERIAAGCVDVVHGGVNVFWVGGFALWLVGSPALRDAHELFGIGVFLTLVSFGWRCPLTLIARYLRERADPGLSRTARQTFVVSWLRRVGLPAADWHITAITLIGTAVMAGDMAHRRLGLTF